MQLIIGQTAKELDFIYKKVKDKNDKICLPLNLETLIFCEKKSIILNLTENLKINLIIR